MFRRAMTLEAIKDQFEWRDNKDNKLILYIKYCESKPILYYILKSDRKYRNRVCPNPSDLDIAFVGELRGDPR